MQFKTEKISEHITRIHGFCTEFMYLIEGSKAAVLIDTGCGFYSLKNCIHNLTNKPLKVLITHGHVDHAMGANEFEEIYLNHKDKSVYQLHSEKGFRLEGAKGLCPEKGLIKETDMIPSAPFEKFHNLQEGDVFELGGIHVVIYELPQFRLWNRSGIRRISVRLTGLEIRLEAKSRSLDLISILHQSPM